MDEKWWFVSGCVMLALCVASVYYGRVSYGWMPMTPEDEASRMKTAVVALAFGVACLVCFWRSHDSSRRDVEES